MGGRMRWLRWSVAGAILMGTVACGASNAPSSTPTVAAGTATASPLPAAQWQQLSVSSGPLPRNSAGFAYDDHTGRLLLSGGRHGCGPSATSYVDTWTLAGSTWQQQHPKTDGPGGMSSFTMTEDAATHQVVALGVFSGCGVATGMFTWTGSDWTAAPASLTLPDPSFSYTLTYDAARQQLVAVGATHPVNAPGKESEQTWTWDGRNWTRMLPAQSPPPLVDAAAAYDPTSRRVILFGGALVSDNGAAGEATAGTWAWDGTNWTQLHPATAPSARRGAAMATDEVLGRAVLFGGIDRSPETSGATVFGDTWIWTGTTWQRQPTAAAPTPRFYAQIAFDPRRKQIVLFGGALNESTDSDDVWVYQDH